MPGLWQLLSGSFAPPASEGTVDAIRSLRLQGRGINAIARELHVGKSTVQRIANEMKEEVANV